MAATAEALRKHKKTRNGRKKERALVEPLPSEGAENSKFARALASCDPLTRKRAVEALTRWLMLRGELRPGQLLRLWKGLFYCFWHSDLVPVQVELAEQLAVILPQLSPQASELYFATFLTTMRREWFGIDRLRLDKFLMLVRKFVRQMFAYLQQHSWDMSLVTAYMALVRGALLPNDTLLAAGVSLQLADVWLVELWEQLGGDALPLGVLHALLSPWEDVLAGSSSLQLLTRTWDSVFEPLAAAVRSPGEESGEALAVDEVAAVAEALFERGAQPEVPKRNRQALYAAHEALRKAAAKRQRTASTGSTAPSARRPAAAANGAAAMAAGSVAGNGQPKGGAAVAAVKERCLKKGKEEVPHADTGNGRKLKRQRHEGARPDGPVLDNRQGSAANGAAEGPTDVAGEEKEKAKLMMMKKKKKKLCAQVAAAAAISHDGPTNIGVHSVGASGHAVPAGELHDKDNGVGTSTGLSEPHQQAVVAAAAAPKTKKLKRKQRNDAAASHASVLAPEGKASQGEVSMPLSGSKSVRWGLNHNLVLTMGQPVPSKEMRTPPRATPKGSALKKGVELPKQRSLDVHSHHKANKPKNARTRDSAKVLAGAGY